ncbi:glycosyl transferase family 2 [Alteromonas sp. BL110]|uniref:glycosyltransferase family 2 protein n=1 Tax=Alteromonas sp. BL110 TaxID=1714845 RepID=UPI000E495E74|nr:galactosyltransferase-related protein [Alteromonas sp. BL110]AXT39981.1 glycosyl transferase family 2 [Alteromonas sp. BL110]RKM79210.1 glycosyl transferase family 2 [Alteromonas sp. BL110]
MRSPVSAVTIVKSRTEKLCNLISQLEQCSPTPDELVIVWMAPPSDLSLIQSEKFDIVHKFTTQGELPIAKARNKGMLAAKHENLVYLNVDAVIAPTLCRDGLLALKDNTVVFTSVVFLPNERCNKPYSDISKNEKQIGYLASNDETLPKEDNNEIPSRDQGNNHGKFSDDSICSTVFFIRKTDFQKTGGFDEGYAGFGLNDEDFFTNCRALGYSLEQLPTRTFAPTRPNYQCPVNHLLDFVHNAQRFHSKWGFYPCSEVLTAYADKGFIDPNFHENGLKVIQLPEQEDGSSNPNENSFIPNTTTSGIEFTSFHSPVKNQERLSSTA